MQQQYLDLLAAITQAGFHASVRDDEVVLASRSIAEHLQGNSFKVQYRNGCWHLVTWSPASYLVPASANLIELCLDCLRVSDSPIGRVPPDISGRYGLIEVQQGDAMRDDGIPTDEHLYYVCRRPKMYFFGIETTRDLIFFLRGFVTGAYPPHTSGSGIGGDFITWLYTRHGRTPPKQLYYGTHDFATVLLEEYGDKPLAETHEVIAGLFREFREAQPGGTGSWLM